MRLTLASVAVLLTVVGCGQGADPLPGDVPHCALSSTSDTTIALPTGSDPLWDGDHRTHWILTAFARVPAGNTAVSGHCALERDNPPSLPGPGGDPVLVVDTTANDYHWAPVRVPGDTQSVADEWICRWEFTDAPWYTTPAGMTDAARAYYTARAHASVCYISTP
jgi:hypothetical protein